MEFLDSGFKVHNSFDPTMKKQTFEVQYRDFSGKRLFLLIYSVVSKLLVSMRNLFIPPICKELQLLSILQSTTHGIYLDYKFYKHTRSLLY